jgi:ssDNA-binding Zn-finger/Zn-ribbon topoisomerase 1
MKKLSDVDLSWLRGHIEALKLSAYPEMADTYADVINAIDELRERREKDPRPGYLPNFQCPNCHDFMVRQDTGCLRCIKCHWTDAATGRENH